jgi:uncharacterized beta-barrel protein YwiB (DUF1934 family)
MKNKGKDNYIITIDNTQYNENGKDHFTLSTVGDYSKDGETRIIRYRDSTATGFEGSETTLHVTSGMVTMIRTGEYASSLILEKGRRHTCHYGTPVGDLPLGINTTKLENGLTDSGGTLDFSYSLDLNANLFAATELKITVREKNTQDA